MSIELLAVCFDGREEIVLKGQGQGQGRLTVINIKMYQLS